MIGPVSAVLLSWKRQYLIPKIVDHLRTFPQIADITVFCNEVVPWPLLTNIDKLGIVYHPQNYCTLGRFMGAEKAETEHVFVQDDDLLVNNIPQLLAEYDGTRIVANLADDSSSKHWTFSQLRPQPYVELGFGSVFPKVFATEYLGMHWTDDEELLCRKSDKAFTCLFPWKAVRAGPEDITRLYHSGEESGRDANALFKRTDHRLLTEAAVAAALRFKSSQADAGGRDSSRVVDASSD